MNEYTIEVKDEYIIFRGPMPINEMLGLLKVYKKRFKDPVFDFEIARRLKVSFCLISRKKSDEYRKIREEK